MPEGLGKDPRFAPYHIVGALLDGHVICADHLAPEEEEPAVALERIRALLKEGRLSWLRRAAALATSRIHCEQCGESLDTLG
jgi:hypothetical protein